MKERHTLSQINSLPQMEFIRLFGGVFEHSPWIAEKATSQRPFPSVTDFHIRLCDIVRNATPDEKLTLISNHPDLVGRAALAGGLTAESTNEQASAGLSKLTAEEIACFQKNNAAYRDKFGFPFVICARLNKKQAILSGFERRLQNNRAQEIETALEEIFKIADFRLRDLVTD